MAARNIPVKRFTIPSGQTGDGISGRGYHWMMISSPSRPRRAPGGRQERGSFYIEGET
jgi:hypothetical protein